MRRSILAFVAGVCTLQCLPAWPCAAWPGPLVAGLLALLAGLASCLRRRSPALFALCAGLLWAAWHAHTGLASRLPPDLDGAAFEVRGRIVDGPIALGHARRFEFAPDAIRRGIHPGPPLRRLALVDYAAQGRLTAGAECRLYVRLRSPRGTRNPAGVDVERVLFARRVDATGYLLAHPGNRCGPAGLAASLHRLRARLARAIDASDLPPPTAAVLRALAVGERAALSDRQWAVLQATGTTHVISISGLHVSMVALATHALVRVAWSLCPALTRRVPAPTLAAALGLLGAAAYSLLAGFTVPTQRTLLMLVCLWWQRRRGQRLLNADGLIVALGAVVAVDPLAVLTASCWLSFGAMAALVALGAVLREGSLVLRALGTHLWLALALTPLLAFVSAFIAWTSPLTNLLVVPLVTWVVVPLTLVGVALALAGQAAAADCWLLAGYMWELGWAGLELVADSAPAWRLPHALPWACVPLVLCGLALPLLPLGRARLWLAPLLCLSPWLAVPAAVPAGAVQLTVFDVGQGLSVLVRTSRHALLYDAGPRARGGHDAGRAVVVPNLRAAGLWQIDRLLLSHADIDHTGGAAAVLAGVDVAEVTINPRDPWRGAASRCLQGQRWQWDGVRFELLHPAAGAQGDDNQLSCVLKITTANGQRALLTGDIDASIEAALIARGAPLAADVLVSPHHGSATSSSSAFVAAVAAQEVIHTAAAGNRYGFPAPAVVARYARHGSRQHRTGAHGALRVELGAGPLRLIRWRDEARRYWHAP